MSSNITSIKGVPTAIERSCWVAEQRDSVAQFYTAANRRAIKKPVFALQRKKPTGLVCLYGRNESEKSRIIETLGDDCPDWLVRAIFIQFTRDYIANNSPV